MDNKNETNKFRAHPGWPQSMMGGVPKTTTTISATTSMTSMTSMTAA